MPKPTRCRTAARDKPRKAMKGHNPSNIACGGATPYVLVLLCACNFTESSNKFDRTHSRAINFKLTTTACSSYLPRADDDHQCSATSRETPPPPRRPSSPTYTAPSPVRTADSKLRALDYTRLSAVAQGVCWRLLARIAALEAHLRPQNLKIRWTTYGNPSDQDPGRPPWAACWPNLPAGCNCGWNQMPQGAEGPQRQPGLEPQEFEKCTREACRGRPCAAAVKKSFGAGLRWEVTVYQAARTLPKTRMTPKMANTRDAQRII